MKGQCMTHTFIKNTAVALGAALALTWSSGIAEANGGFTALAGIPAEVLSHSEMEAVEGKVLLNDLDISLDVVGLGDAVGTRGSLFKGLFGSDDPGNLVSGAGSVTVDILQGVETIVFP
jgi:hypothetical protein